MLFSQKKKIIRRWQTLAGGFESLKTAKIKGREKGVDEN